MINNRPHWADTAIAIFTGLMLVTYITANYFSCQQLKLTQATLNELKSGSADTHALAVSAGKPADNTKTIAQAAKEQVTKLDSGVTETRRLAIAAAKSARAAFQQAETAHSALRHAEERFIKEQRPVIWAKPSGPQIEVGQKLRWILSDFNYGHSVALNVRFSVKLTYGIGATLADIPPTSIKECRTPSPGTASVMPPGYQGFMPLEGSRDLTEADIAGITSPTGIVVANGVIEYDDTSEHRYRSTFCFHTPLGRPRSGDVMECAKHNAITQLK